MVLEVRRVVHLEKQPGSRGLRGGLARLQYPVFAWKLAT